MKKRGIIGEIIFYAIIFVVLFIVVYNIISAMNQPEQLSNYSDVVTTISNDEIENVYLSYKNVLTITYKDKTVKQYKVAEVMVVPVTELLGEQSATKGFTYEIQPDVEYPWWLSLLPWLLIIGVIVLVFVMFSKTASKDPINNFGKARIKTPSSDPNKKVLFKDVAGADEEKEELVEIVEFLKDPTKFTKLGAKIPHGVLLVGPPGTGKTLLAKAVAGEAGVPFFSISGSDFMEMYVGVGASRVRDLFDTARKYKASIIFIDEIDAIGRHRGAGLGGGHDEREQTLNQMLVEMDGFDTHSGTIVMAATNRPDILDPALLRPGRFDRRITVNYPDIKGREDILAVHAQNKPLDADVDFHKIALETVGMTGADLANLLNEAALLAAKKNKSLIGMDDIEDSFMKILLGPQKKNKKRRDIDNKLVAYHEAGHAVVTYYCKHSDPVKHITIIPAGDAGGVTVRVPVEDQFGETRGEMLDNIRISLGGRIAEELIMDDISTGASGDIQKATQVARNMVTRYGMSEKLGTVLYGNEHTSDEVFLGRDYSSGKNYSEETAAAIDNEIRTIISEAYAYAKQILTEHKDKLTFVAEFLLAHESMDGEQFAKAMEDGATMEDVVKIATDKEEARKQRNKEKEEANKQEQEQNSEEKPAIDHLFDDLPQ